MSTVQIDSAAVPKNKRPGSFGSFTTELMFLARFSEGAWKDAHIKPYGDLWMSPLAACFHYGQTVFEGLKAYRLKTGEVSIFRASKHAERLNASLRRMCMPELEDGFLENAMNQLVFLQQDWVSNEAGHALYIRPFVVATEAKLMAKPSDQYLFCIVCLPMGPYYDQNLKVKVERCFVRAVEGGVGFAKCGGNYGGAFYPTQLVQQEGFDQLIWTDGQGHEYMEESGTMNLMFFIKDCLVTPPLNGAILDGVTRDSVLTLARSQGLPVEERKTSYKELQMALKNGEQVEAFGVGTAASLTPIELIHIEGENYPLEVGPRAIVHGLKESLDAIRRGVVADTFGWNHIVKEAKDFLI